MHVDNNYNQKTPLNHWCTMYMLLFTQVNFSKKIFP